MRLASHRMQLQSLPSSRGCLVGGQSIGHWTLWSVTDALQSRRLGVPACDERLTYNRKRTVYREEARH